MRPDQQAGAGRRPSPSPSPSPPPPMHPPSAPKGAMGSSPRSEGSRHAGSGAPGLPICGRPPQGGRRGGGGRGKRRAGGGSVGGAGGGVSEGGGGRPLWLARLPARLPVRLPAPPRSRRAFSGCPPPPPPAVSTRRPGLFPSAARRSCPGQPFPRRRAGRRTFRAAPWPRGMSAACRTRPPRAPGGRP